MTHRGAFKRLRIDDAINSVDEGQQTEDNSTDVDTEASQYYDAHPPVQNTITKRQSSNSNTSGSSPQPQDRVTSNEHGESSAQSRRHSSAVSVDLGFRRRTQQKAQSSKRRASSRQRKVRERERICESVDDENLEDYSNLYKVILNNSSSLKEIADRWIEKYKNDGDGALLDLQQFFVNSSGCNYHLTPDMQNMESADLISQMLVEEFHPDNGEYPFKMVGRKWEKFREDFCEFLQNLVHQCRNSIIYDQRLLPDMKRFLIELSDSPLRTFRHVGTLAAMKLMTALVEICVKVTRNLTITKRQLDTEKRKAKGSRNRERLATLAEKFEEFEENTSFLMENLHDLYTSIFVRRYIDILADIRVICIHEIGVWMKMIPNIFITDRYLKYVGWNLFDRAAEVRLECIQSLKPLYASETFKPQLEGFTSQFKARIVAMVQDKDCDVAVEAIKLVTSLFMYYPEFLTDQDSELVFTLVYSPNRGIAQAAGIFLKEHLISSDEEDSVGRSRGDANRLSNRLYIRDLVRFFIESELIEHAAYLVDSLIDSNPLIKDWECMIDLLLVDGGEDEAPLSNKAEMCLIDIMVCSVKQSATGEGPVGRTPARNIYSKSNRKQVQVDKNKLTELFIPALPHLLEKYRADPEKLANLLVLPQYFELTGYTTLREEQSLISLLRKINEIVTNNLNVEVLEMAAKTLELMCADNSPIFTQTDLSRSMLIDSLVEKYKEAIVVYRNKIASSISPEEDEIFAVVQSIKILSIFYCSHDMNSWNIQDSLFRDLEYAKDPSGEFPKDVVVYCIRACHFSILWCHNRLMNPAENSVTELEDEANQLKQRLHCFIDTLKCFIDNDRTDVTTPPEVREEAYSTICDLLVVFSNPPTDNSNALLHTLTYEIDTQMRTLLNHFIQEHVFNDEEDVERDEESKIEELHKRRNLLAGYCKLIIYNILATKWAADVFKHYVKYYNDYGDIIKTTLNKARGINKINCAVAMQHSLNILYLEIVAEKGQMQRKSDEFRAVKELARKFALLYGYQVINNRDAIVALHRAGILFATAPSYSTEVNSSDPPPNLPFLEILDEFTKKLLKVDKRAVLEYLDSKVQSPQEIQGKKWKPLLVYRNNLLRDATGGNPAMSSKDRVSDNNSVEVSGRQTAQKAKSKLMKKRAPKKNPLLVTKSKIARGSIKPSLHKNTDQSLTPDSPQPSIEDQSQGSLHGVVDRIESLELQSQMREHDQNQEPHSSRSYVRASEFYGDEEYTQYASLE